MTASFKPLDDSVFNEHLELPIGDRVWAIASPPGDQGLRVSRLVAGAMNLRDGQQPTSEQLRSFQFNDEEEEQLMKDLLGEDTFAELMKTYNWSTCQHVLMTVIVWVAFNADAAAAYWSADPNFGTNRRQRRAAKKK